MPSVLSKELDIENVRYLLGNVYQPAGRKCRTCKKNLNIYDAMDIPGDQGSQTVYRKMRKVEKWRPQISVGG